MNIGTTSHSRYICDKCGNEIYYIGQKGFEGLNKYYKQRKHDYACKKDFDLCESCEKKFRKWLKEKDIPTAKDVINRFPIYKED